MINEIAVNEIRIDGGTQPRVEIDEHTVSEYAETIDQLPPITVFFDGSVYWLADGFHRWHAHRLAGRSKISSDVRPGSRRDAILFSVGANSSHGLRRSNADKRRAVETLLRDDEWVKWSDSKIAELCCVSDKTVASVRTSIFGNPKIEMSRTVERGGKVYQQNTENIGKTRANGDVTAAEQISHPKPAPESAPPDPRKNSRDRSDDIERLEEENAKLREEVIALEEQLSAAMDAAEAAAELSTTLERYEAIIGGEADKMIHDLQIMVERLKEDRRRIEVMRDDKMNENAQLIKEVKMLRRKLAKYEG